MGNSQSSDDPTKSPSSTARRDRGREGSQGRSGSGSAAAAGGGGGRVPSAATARKPSATPTTLQPSPSNPTTSTSTATVSANPATSRTRSTTNPPADEPESSMMGNAPSRSKTHPIPGGEMTTNEKAEAAQPVDVPQQPSHRDGRYEQVGNHATDSTAYTFPPPSDYNRPPRLPLPIERDPEPSSPIVAPRDPETPVEPINEGDEANMKRRTSMLSSTTLDDEEAADIETFTLESDSYAQKVQTTLEYWGEGKLVYVTGTFAHWEKKFKMQKGPEKGGKAQFTLTAALPTGTHHIKFLVDGEMVLSDQYPTTVDFTNSLVNYVEIAAPLPEGKQPPAPAEPMPIPGATVSGQPTGGDSQQLPIRSDTRAAETKDDMSSTLQETVAPAASVPAKNNAGPSVPHASQLAAQQQQQQQQQLQQQQQARPAKPKQPRPKYTNEIPDVLLNLDLFNSPDDERYRRATKAIQHLPQPPSLPMFMSKSILNATTPHKDDASVLTMPNHTILNHLATSSIRSGVLATSGTTRYKRKFLTTIMYKPTSDEG